MNDAKDDRRWALTAEALELLIEAVRGAGNDPVEEYFRIRNSLVRYFEKRCPQADADALVDETLDRIAKQLSEGKQLDLTGSRAYFFAVARLVMLESIRRAKRLISLDDPTAFIEPEYDAEAAAKELSARINREIGRDAVIECKQRLSDKEREILETYDLGKGREKIERRDALAAKLGKTKSTLIVAISRIRTKVKECVRSKLPPDFSLELA